jgi:hypothetical protein
MLTSDDLAMLVSRNVKIRVWFANVTRFELSNEVVQARLAPETGDSGGGWIRTDPLVGTRFAVQNVKTKVPAAPAVAASDET